MEQRLAAKGDLPDIMALADEAKAFMRSCGLIQWQDGYPSRADFAEDIERGDCHVFTEDGEIAAVVCITKLPEECYEKVYGGAWLTGDAPYIVIHRLAVGDKYRGRGIGAQIIAHSERLAAQCGRKSLRADTHEENKAMRRMLEKNGFVHCGRVFLKGEDEPDYARVVYEKVLS